MALPPCSGGATPGPPSAQRGHPCARRPFAKRVLRDRVPAVWPGPRGGTAGSPSTKHEPTPLRLQGPCGHTCGAQRGSTDVGRPGLSWRTSRNRAPGPLCAAEAGKVGGGGSGSRHVHGPTSKPSSSAHTARGPEARVRVLLKPTSPRSSCWWRAAGRGGCAQGPRPPCHPSSPPLLSPSWSRVPRCSPSRLRLFNEPSGPGSTWEPRGPHTRKGVSALQDGGPHWAGGGGGEGKPGRWGEP